MEILQPSWRGRCINSRTDSGGRKYTAMIGNKSLLYIPVNVLPNAVYKITLELCKESGNGEVYCNIYGNRNFDFPQSRVSCETSNWTTFDIDVITKDFPKTVPMVFRIWRGKESTGTILVRRIIVELKECEIEDANTNGKVISIEDKGHSPINPANFKDGKRIKKPKREKPPRRLGKVENKEKKKEKNNRNKFELKNKKINENYVHSYDENKDGKRALYLYLPIERFHHQSGTDRAFLENGFNLTTFDFHSFNMRYGVKKTADFFIKIANDFKPDWIHCQLQDSNAIYNDTLIEIKKNLPKTYITNWTGDIREVPIKYFVSVSNSVDLSLISSKGQIELYKNAGCKNVEYWQIGYDENIFYRLTDEERELLYNKYNNDIVFCGNPTGYRGNIQRVDVINTIRSNFKNFGTYGSYPNSKRLCSFFEQQFIYNGAKLVLSINNFNDVEMYFSDRQLVSMASGTLTLSHYIPGLEKYFTNNEDLVWFKDKNEIVNIIEYYLSNPDKANQIGKNGAEKVRKYHTYYERIKELSKRINIVNSQKKYYIYNESNDIKMSIVMGTYNRIKSLKKSIKSILESNLNEIEIIVNDGGSTDGTIEYLKSINDNRVKSIFTGKLTDITSVYNECFKKASGTYVSWFSDDVISVNDSIDTMYNLIKYQPKNTICGYKYKHKTTNFLIPETNGMINPPIACVNRKFLSEINFWNNDYPFYGQDLEFNARVLRSGGRIISSDACVIHLDIFDDLKKNNVNEYNKNFCKKFDIIYKNEFGDRYGLRSKFLYPVFLIIPDENLSSSISLIKSLYDLYKNSYFAIPVSKSYIYSFCKYANIFFINDIDDWDNYDLIFKLEKFLSIYNYKKENITEKTIGVIYEKISD